MIKHLAFCACLLIMHMSLAANETGRFETLHQHVFIGQAYPSGNVYLRRFTGDTGTSLDWPKYINLQPIAPDTGLTVPAKAHFVKLMQSKTENNIVKSVYIPGSEGMDVNHDPCGLGEIKKSNPTHRRLSGDFFNTIIDHCESNDDVAVYRISPSSYSFMVLGTDNTLSLSEAKVIKQLKRPMTPTEQQQVARKKQATRKETANYDCTTNPAYLDSAIQLFTAQLSGKAASLRLSHYFNPGCAGHLAGIYVLDILTEGNLVSSINLYQYQGAL